MEKKIFEKKVVYYLAVTISFIFCLVSIFSTLSLFNDFSLLKLLFVSLGIIINLFAFINLIEKYNKAILFLNLSLCFYMIFSGGVTLMNILTYGLSFNYNSFKFLVLFIITLIVVNKYKIKKNKAEYEIENIGQNEE
ncbi:hypothetical protein [Chryseobacterium populi]|uniref:Uncharacterized protein n=1 Tax=Chryseobacterium populi TaxID=1144316 RepID=J3CJC9_9FLAO|nr:hypothetical protein [Chryseobacterium populi]EJL72656.1 hypothetical protein PMI13_01803 [Chryseobacterium populi]